MILATTDSSGCCSESCLLAPFFSLPTVHTFPLPAQFLIQFLYFLALGEVRSYDRYQGLNMTIGNAWFKSVSRSGLHSFNSEHVCRVLFFFFFAPPQCLCNPLKEVTGTKHSASLKPEANMQPASSIMISSLFGFYQLLCVSQKPACVPVVSMFGVNLVGGFLEPVYWK